MLLRVLGVTAGSVVAVLAGTAAHEGTHWLAAWLLDADIKSVSLLPPAPEVVYWAATPRVDILIRVSTVLCSPLLTAGLLLVAKGRPLTQQLLLAAFVVAYLPRSMSDWEPILSVLT